jgi:hypothetical protein
MTSTPEASGTVAPETAASVTSLNFQVTTTANGGRYQPKNVGAIWIEDKSGKLVKSLKVWAGTRRRYLTGYVKALGGTAVDVTASATLRTHQTHTVSWDLRDRNGTAVTPGAYRVKMELTDADATGKSNAVDFDTSKGAASVMPPDAPCFSSMKLELQ